MQPVAQIVQVGALGHVVDLGGDGQPFIAGGCRARPGDRSRRRGRQRVDETLQLRLEARPVSGVQGDVGDQPPPIDQDAPDGFQFGQYPRPVGIDLLDQLPQEEQLADAARLLAGPVRLGKPGAQAAEDGHVPARHQPRFRARLFLQGHLPEAGRVVQPGGQQHVAQDVQQVGGLGDHRLAMQEQPGGGRVAAAPDRRDQRGRRDAARLAPDALRQLDEILGLGAHLQQGPAKQRHIRQQILRQGVEVKAQVEVDNAIGEQIVVEQLPLAQRQMLNRDAPDVPVEVGQRQGGDGRQRLRRVGRLLDAAQLLRVGDHGLEGRPRSWRRGLRPDGPAPPPRARRGRLGQGPGRPSSGAGYPAGSGRSTPQSNARRRRRP